MNRSRLYNHSLFLALTVFAWGGSAFADEPWVELLNSSGAVGFKKVGKTLVACKDVGFNPKEKNLSAIEGQGVIAALTRANGDDNNLHSIDSFGDCEVKLEFLIGRGSNSGVKLQSRYEIQLFDSHSMKNPSGKDCGGVYPHWKFKKTGGLDYIDKGVPPSLNAALPAGQWQTLEIDFTAPRFSEEGKKTANALFKSVVLNGKTVQENVELDSPTGNASSPMPEISEAPLMLQLDHGPVAFRNVRVKRLSN